MSPGAAASTYALGFAVVAGHPPHLRSPRHQWFPDIAWRLARRPSTLRCAISGQLLQPSSGSPVCATFACSPSSTTTRTRGSRSPPSHDEAGYRPRPRDPLRQLQPRQPQAQPAGVGRGHCAATAPSPCATQAYLPPALGRLRRCSAASPTCGASPSASKSPTGRQRHLPADNRGHRESTTHRRWIDASHGVSTDTIPEFPRDPLDESWTAGARHLQHDPPALGLPGTLP